MSSQRISVFTQNPGPVCQFCVKFTLKQGEEFRVLSSMQRAPFRLSRIVRACAYNAEKTRVPKRSYLWRPSASQWKPISWNVLSRKPISIRLSWQIVARPPIDGRCRAAAATGIDRQESIVVCTLLLYRRVCAQHGRDVMGWKSPVGVPRLTITTTGLAALPAAIRFCDTCTEDCDMQPP